MKKIMFSDKFGLTQAVLEGRKTMTRRSINCPNSFKGQDVIGFHVYRRASYGKILEYPIMYDDDEMDIDGAYIMPKYQIGEEIAVAQAYKDFNDWSKIVDAYPCAASIEKLAGYSNKMFVRGDLMPYRIRITDVRAERLQDISDEDCLKEGIWKAENIAIPGTTYWYPNLINSTFRTPREAFSSLIDKISGKRTWQRNPWVFVYEFELVD